MYQHKLYIRDITHTERRHQSIQKPLKNIYSYFAAEADNDYYSTYNVKTTSTKIFFNILLHAKLAFLCAGQVSPT